MPPVIDQEKCLECYDCIVMEDCPQDVFREGNFNELAIVIVSPENCIGCGFCVDECSGHAIILSK